jgi:acyl carrier protein
MAPKVAGTLYLDEQTRDLSLDFFVCFSSATSVLGASGQSNYSAANAFLDAFAHHRASRGLAATAINWGPGADVGMAARLDERDRLRQQRMGWDSIPLDAGFAILDRLLASKAVQVAVLPIRWGKYARSVPGASHSPLLANVLPRQTAADSPAATVPSRTAADDLLECLPENREPLLTTYVTDEVVSLLGLSDVTSLDPQTGFADLGMDSLMSIEFRSRLQKGLGIKLSATFAFDYPNIEAVTDYLMGTLFERDEGASEEPRSPVSSDRPTVPAELPAPEAVDASVDEAVDDLIEEELLKLEAQLDKDPSRDGDG